MSTADCQSEPAEGSGLRWFAGVATRAGDDLWVLSIERSIRQGPLHATDQQQLARLRGPLGIAADVARELGIARAAGLADAFDLLGSAALVADESGRVIRANRTAEKSLTSDLRVINGRLTVHDPEISKSIRQLIDETVASQAGEHLRPPVTVPRPEGRPLAVYAIPLAGDARNAFSPARVLVVVLDLDTRTAAEATHLREVFGLTLAEAKLLARMARGESLETAAELLRISKETARSQLKTVFAKTETTRQPELIALVARLLPDHG
jgi:DNA-binding CsgD family transcriptional regulator/PAS domain-containing protein